MFFAISKCIPYSSQGYFKPHNSLTYYKYFHWHLLLIFVVIVLSTDQIDCYYKKNLPSDCILRDESNTAIALRAYFQRKELLVVHPRERLSPGTYILSINFTYIIRNNLAGLYYSTYTAPDEKTRTILTTQMEPLGKLFSWDKSHLLFVITTSWHHLHCNITEVKMQ